MHVHIRWLCMCFITSWHNLLLSLASARENKDTYPLVSSKIVLLHSVVCSSC